MRNVLVVLVLALAACGDPAGPGESVTGRWTASQVDILHNVSYDVTDNGGSLSGTWTAYMDCYTNPAGRCQQNGTISSGSRNGDDFTITMEPVSPCGHGNYELAVTRSGGSASGTIYYLDCRGNRTPFTLPVTLSKQ